jgi:hypothetical protein
MIKWSASKDEHDLIIAIVRRVLAHYPDYPDDTLTLMMDLEACHCNGCPLDLRGLLESHNEDLMHDVFGIRRHINRETGQLNDCFLPRYSKERRFGGGDEVAQ